jgi:hypothetical protein
LYMCSGLTVRNDASNIIRSGMSSTGRRRG